MIRIAILLFLGLLFSSCGKDEPNKAQTRLVRFVTIQHKSTAESLSLTGLVQAQDQVNLAFRVGGRLLERKVSVGDHVTPGEIVARLEPQDFQNALRSAEADLSSAHAVLANAKATESRQKELLGKGFTTQAQYDHAAQQLRTAQAQVDAATARFANARDNLSYTDLKSDIAGSITAKGAEPGEVIAVGHMVLRVAREGARDAVFNVPAQLIRSAPRDPIVTIALSEDPNITTTGHVREVAPQAEATTGTYIVKVGLDNPPEAMRLGASVVGHLAMDTAPVILLPGMALMQKDGKPAVWVVDPATQTVSLREITIKRYDSASAVVSTGLQDGELVVTAGVQALYPGQQVRLLETKADVAK